ncbi:MAG: hypothetical protein JO026_01500, partial [Patescibacteria group bacterium]|nr:hypothetical protein [Patescibacteria group bacterium]
MSAGKLLSATADTLLLPFRRLSMSDPVRNFLNREGIARYNANPPHLSLTAERIVGDLRKNGIARATFEELFSPADFQRLLGYAASLEGAAKSRSKKPFILEYWDPYPVFSFDNPFVELSLRPEVLAIVDTYLEQWGKFYYYMLGLSVPEDGAEARNSQQWHRDPEDKKICKMF